MSEYGEKRKGLNVRICNNNKMENSFLDSCSTQEKANYYKFMTCIEKRGRVNTNMSPCWTINGSKSSSGYGQISFQNKHWNLHRYSYWIHNGRPNLTCKDQVMHKCDNKECANPEHLKLGNAKINNQEAIERGLISSGTFKKGENFGELNNNAKLTWEKVREIRRRKAEGLKYGELKSMAVEYDIEYITIQKIVQGSLWKEI